MAEQKESNPFSQENLPKRVVNAEFAVRGAIVQRSLVLKAKLKAGKGHGLPFEKLISCNTGNPQSLGQKPVTFIRQVLSGVLNPSLLEVDGLFPADVKDRVQKLLGATASGSIGAYSNSQGLDYVREKIAEFITERDGKELGTASAKDIYLTDGASAGIKNVLQCLVGEESQGVLLPRPQYPLYSAHIALLGGTRVDYPLSEEAGWGLDVAAMRVAIEEASKAGVTVKALVVINPGNPTGQCWNEQNIRDAIILSKEFNMAIIADEVYQANIYKADMEFTSFRKVLLGMDAETKNSVPLISFHSISKGVLGECGLRGGYMELQNVPDSGRMQLYKLSSVCLCSNTIGQVTLELMCNPPKAGEPSYELYTSECAAQLESLRVRANLMSESLNAIDGIDCQPINGAMYAFPQISLPDKLVKFAKEEKSMAADLFYCMELLDTTGIIVVPGSGFGQKEGTWHFRTTILPPKEQMLFVVEKFKEFHLGIVKKFSD